MAQVTIPANVKITMAVLAIFMPLFLIIPFFIWTGPDSEAVGLNDINLQAARLAPIGRLNIDTPKQDGDNASDAAAQAEVVLDPDAEYQKVCSVCHAAGIAGAPLFGDKASWQAKLDEAGGVDAMVKRAIGGINAMPPKGGSTLSDADFAEMVHYMLKNAGLE